MNNSLSVVSMVFSMMAVIMALHADRAHVANTTANGQPFVMASTSARLPDGLSYRSARDAAKKRLGGCLQRTPTAAELAMEETQYFPDGSPIGNMAVLGGDPYHDPCRVEWRKTHPR